MADLVRVGNPIPLNLQLSDDDGALFPQATLKDATGSPILGSPAALTHVGGGLYTNNAITFPPTSRVYAVYRVYDDAAHTARSNVHFATAIDAFDRDLISETIAALGLTFQGSLPGEQLSGTLEDSQGQLVGIIMTDEILFGEIHDFDSLFGVIIEPDLIDGILESGGELVGYLEC